MVVSLKAKPVRTQWASLSDLIRNQIDNGMRIIKFLFFLLLVLVILLIVVALIILSPSKCKILHLTSLAPFVIQMVLQICCLCRHRHILTCWYDLLFWCYKPFFRLDATHRLNAVTMVTQWLFLWHSCKLMTVDVWIHLNITISLGWISFVPSPFSISMLYCSGGFRIQAITWFM